MLVEVITHNVTDGAAPTDEDVNDWIDAYGITFPVLRDDADDSNFWTYSDGAFPTKVLLDHDDVIAISHSDVAESDIEDLLSDYN